MKFNIGEAFIKITKVLSLNLTLNEGMKELLYYCRSNYNSEVWHKIEGYDFENDKLELKKWLESTIQNEPPDEEFNAIWFGIFNTVMDRNEVSSLYFYGVNYEIDEDFELEGYEPIYIPISRYGDSKILFDISVTLREEDNKISEVGEYVLNLGYVVLAVKSIMKNLDERILTKLKDNCIIFVGFDEGDYINLGYIKNQI